MFAPLALEYEDRMRKKRRIAEQIERPRAAEIEAARGQTANESRKKIEITSQAILNVMRDPRNHSRTLWTASVVLDRMGVYRRFEDPRNYSNRDRLRVKKLLEDLHRSGDVVIVKERHTLHSATSTPEVAYGLAEREA